MSLLFWSWWTISVLLNEAFRMFTESTSTLGVTPRLWLGSRGVIDAPESEGIKPEAVPTQSELSPGRRRGGWRVCECVSVCGVWQRQGWGGRGGGAAALRLGQRGETALVLGSGLLGSVSHQRCSDVTPKFLLWMDTSVVVPTWRLHLLKESLVSEFM